MLYYGFYVICKHKKKDSAFNRSIQNFKQFILGISNIVKLFSTLDVCEFVMPTSSPLFCFLIQDTS